MRCDYIPYKTKTFAQLWQSAVDFKEEFKASPLYSQASGFALTDNSIELTFYLLYAKFGNSPIANMDENQAKFKFFTTMWKYGPLWQKKVDIQGKLRSLGIDSTSEIFLGSSAIYNHAFNPENEPATTSPEELAYINDQNVTKYKKSILEGLASLNDLLSANETDTYIDKFRKIFKIFVGEEDQCIYVTDEEEVIL